MIDYYDDGGMVDHEKVVKAVSDIDKRLKDEKDGGNRTRLMYEQMLRGLYFQMDGTCCKPI